MRPTCSIRPEQKVRHLYETFSVTPLDPPRDIRADSRAAFLRGVGRGAALLEPLPVDASLRRYFRLRDSGAPVLLMDAPPPGEDIRPFVRIGRHLAALGLSTPVIYEMDEVQGFALIEDFGDATYSRLLEAGADPQPLFKAATDVLVALHIHPAGAKISAPAYDNLKFLAEIAELPDWYGLAVTGGSVPNDSWESFIGLWRDVLDRLPPPDLGLVLLDYHVDNLMALPGRSGAAACGLLDFQDARIGPRSYDLLCLLRNERRGIAPSLSDALYDYYLDAVKPLDPAGFGLWYRVLAAQRYTKVAGRFARLTLRDGRDGYLRYMPRVIALLTAALDSEPLLWPIRDYMGKILPDWRESLPDNAAALRQRVASTVPRS
jgi:aminoglycoside/choline kinase family phosphotransferase